MAVVGVDFGNMGARVAVAQNRGIDMISNEVNSRTTPSFVQFNEDSRAIGESALSQYTRNVRHTISNLKFLLGRKFADPEVQKEKSWIPFQIRELEDGNVGAVVNTQDEEKVYRIEFVLGMLFAKLAKTTASSLKTGIAYSVVACPSFFSDYQRRALIAAYRIGGVNPLRVVNEVTAAAYGFGMYQKDLPDSSEMKVAFVDFGESSLQCSIIAFSKSGLKVLASTFDRTLGGREFDRCLATHFAKEIQKKYRIDVFENKKALVRLLMGCEKTKKILSANPKAPLHVPSIMDDIDVSLVIERNEFEAFSAPLFDRIKKPLQEALEIAKIPAEELAAVEQIGGSVRIPRVQDLVKEVFGRDPGRRLNSEECVAKGCAMQCAVLSPKFQVKKDFKVRDVSMNPVVIRYCQKGDDGRDVEQPETAEIFVKNNVTPSTKMMTFKTPERVEIVADYSQGADLPFGSSPHLGDYSVPKGKSSSKGTVLSSNVKVKVRLDENGLFTVDSATLEEEVEIEEEKKVEKKEEEKKVEEKKEGEKKEGEKEGEEKKEEGTQEGGEKPDEEMKDAPAEEKPAVPEPETEKILTKKTLKVALAVSSQVVSSLDEKQIVSFHEEEIKMAAHDQLIVDTAEARNALESYVYEIRPRVNGGDLVKFFKDEAAKEFVSQLNSTEDWLYEDEGENATKSTYVSRHTDLKKKGDHALTLQFEDKHRADCIKSVQGNVTHFSDFAKTEDEKYAHISVEDRQKVLDKCAEAQQWLNAQMEAQSALTPSDVPVLKISDLRSKQDELYKFANPIMTKPKPAPPKEEKKEASEEKKEPSANEEPKKEEPKKEEPPKEDKPASEIPEPMEVDLD
eukprot:CAMPEP_0201475304 /NCGR_PEP_ID=MMETSP0151_2-20130828/747_1 /ASSEMBLY_ACC=CAM_ASM_000257 /TAXON_ID=200890 /ORGANISM="Paramoeba atlantica, Strain 621/1 / CCAP 1560/9" /LENGTH=847 /DNA_ID=CAMNT_0047855359 /DNA_START=88 /DNA_END=2631 /DNA_ORIENTATION=+